jgi:glutamate synthase domain-containing protein 2/rubredoxin
MAIYQCNLCGYTYDEETEGQSWDELPDDWTCPVCGSPKSEFSLIEQDAPAESPSAQPEEAGADDYLVQWARQGDDLETHMADIHQMALTGESITEPMRTKARTFSWDDLLIKGAQLAKIPLNENDPVNTQTVLGPNAKHPLVIKTPIYITHMSFGALSREIKVALAKGSSAVKTAMCSGEGGILDESLGNAHKYIFEYVPNQYSVTDHYLQRVDAIEIKIGQSAKPGMGGHLPGNKVTKEIAEVRGFPEGVDIISPSHFVDIKNKDDLREKVDWLREQSGGKPIGIKIAAGHIEADLEVALYARPDFLTIDGRPGATGAAPKFVKQATSIPTIFAICRARKYLDEKGVDGVTLLVTGGFRISSDFAKALALGADGVAIGTAALMAAACQQYRICHTGKCPMGVATQDPELRARLDIEKSAQRLENFLKASTGELKNFARMTGNDDVHSLSISDVCTTNSEISSHTDIEHV